MKLSKMIKSLEEIKQKHGDINCWHNVDIGGDRFEEIYYPPSVMFRLPNDGAIKLRYINDINSVLTKNEDEYQDEYEYQNNNEDEDFEPLKIEYVVCVN